MSNDIRQQGGVSSSIRKQLGLISAFGSRDLKTKFKGSALGWIWSLLVPASQLLIYTLVFSFLLKIPPPHMGTREYGIFAIWLFAGLVVWGFFSNSINAGMGALIGSGGMLKKVYFPPYSPVLGSALAVGIQSSIELGLLLVVLLFFLNVSWTWLLLPLIVLPLIVFSCSLATILAIFNALYRDVAHLVTVVLQLLFYATPIIYPLTIVKEVYHKFGMEIHAHKILGANPLTAYTQVTRDLLYELNTSSPYYWIVAWIWAFAMLGLAVVAVQRHGRDLGERI